MCGKQEVARYVGGRKQTYSTQKPIPTYKVNNDQKTQRKAWVTKSQHERCIREADVAFQHFFMILGNFMGLLFTVLPVTAVIHTHNIYCQYPEF